MSTYARQAELWDLDVVMWAIKALDIVPQGSALGVWGGP